MDWFNYDYYDIHNVNNLNKDQNSDIPKVNNLWIIGNKFNVDKNDNEIEEVLEEEGEELAQKYGASFIVFSNKDPNIFEKIIENIIKRIVDQKNTHGDFGNKFKMIKETRTAYHSVAPYFSDYYTTTETYEKKVYLEEKKKNDKKNKNKCPK